MSVGADSLLFFDTNILLYWLDARNPAKQAAARTWLLTAWEQRRARVSWQVLNEFYANAAGKLGAPPREARALAEVFAKLNPRQHSVGLMRRAWHWADTARLSYWDGLILASAEEAGCDYLLSEDFQTGRKYAAVTAVNPFKELPESFGLVPA